MEAFGKNLRKQREFRSIELEEIAETTMINLRFLQAIESGRSQDLPHPTFVKGFLRAYAQHIGINADEVVLGYEQILLAEKGEEEIQTEEPARATNYLEVIKNFPLAAKVGAGVFFCALLAIALWPGKEAPLPEMKKQAIKKPVAVAPIPKPVEKLKGPEPVKPVVSAPKKQVPEVEQAKKTPVVIEKVAPEPEAKPIIASASVISLVIQASEDSWLLVEIDGEKTLDFILRTGESKTLEAKNKILFKTIGNSAALSFSLAGQTLPLGGKSGKVLHDIVIEGQTDLKQLVEKLNAKL